MTEVVAPIIPITPEAARDLGRMAFGEGALTPDTAMEGARKLLDQGNAERALQELAAPASVPHDRRDVKDGLKNRYSTARDADGKRKNPTDPQERRRLGEAEGKVEAYRDFLENGTISPVIRDEVKSFLTRSSVAFQDAIAGKLPADVDVMVDEYILNNPVFRSKLIRVYGERAKPKQSLKGEKDVHDLELSLAKLEAQLKGEVSSTDIAAAQTEVLAKESALVATGANLADVVGWQTDLDNLSPGINEARVKKTTLHTAYTQIDSQITAIETTLSGMTPSDPNYLKLVNGVSQLRSKPEYVNYQQADLTVQRYDKARTELNNLSPTQKTAMSEYTSAQEKLHSLKERAAKSKSPTERADIEAQIKNEKMALADARDALQKEMIDDYRSVTHMAEDVTQEMLSEQLKRLPELYRTAKTTEQSKEQEQLAEVTEKLHKTWKDPITRRGIMSLMTNRRRAGQWISAWTQRGNEGIASQMRSLTVPELVNAGLTPQEVTLFRAALNDPDKSKKFLAESADIVATQALADYVSSGGRLGRAEMTAMTGSEKGRELIRKVMGDVEAQRAARNELAGKGLLKGVDNIIGGRASGEKRSHGVARIGLASLLLLFGLAAFKGSKG